MSNHFHILVEVPQRPETLPSDEVLFGLLERGYSKGFAQTIFQRLELMPANERQALRESFFARMWDVSAFMKLLKQRFTQWFNQQQGGKDTLWEERFKSVLVDGAGEALATMAAYIDLNPVRAGIGGRSQGLSLVRLRGGRGRETRRPAGPAHRDLRRATG